MNGRAAVPSRARVLAAALAALAVAAGAPDAAAQQDPAGEDAPEAAADTTPDRAGTDGDAVDRDDRGQAFLGGYALLAYDPTTGQVGAVSASSGFSAGSGTLAVEAERGAAAVLGGRSSAARRAAARALRAGDGAGEATTRAVSAAGRPPGLQVSALTTDCARSARTSGDAYPWTGTVEGRAGDVCFLAVGAFLADSAVVGRMAGGFRDADGSLLERLQSALASAEVAAGEGAAGEVARSRSAAVWISAPEGEEGPLGRPDLRLQVEDVQRPADALRYLIRTGRAEDLARRASLAVDAGEHDRALELADRASELDPTTPLAWMARGRALLYRGEDGEAEEAFRRMLEVNPHLLHLLGDASGAARDTADDGARGAPEVREELIPYRPRLILRLDEYRRAFYRQVEFPDRDVDGEGDDSAGGDGP